MVSAKGEVMKIFVSFRAKRKILLFPETQMTRKIFTRAATFFLINLIEFFSF